MYEPIIGFLYYPRLINKNMTNTTCDIIRSNVFIPIINGMYDI